MSLRWPMLCPCCVPAGGLSGQGKTQLVQQLALRRFGGPQVRAVRGGGVDDGVHRLRRQRHLLFQLRELFIKLGYALRGLFFLAGDACPSWVTTACQLLSS